MISDALLDEAYVWMWLPNAGEPVVAGRIFREGPNLLFNYGNTYLARENSIPIYDPELPLRSGYIPLLPGLSIPACLRDAAPDAWGRRVILNRRSGIQGPGVDIDQLDELTCLLESGSDRVGALDFQRSPTVYRPREAETATLDELVTAAERVEAGVALTPELERALFHGSSIGGARPKALIESGETKYIAKFSSSSDLYSVVKSEYLAMRLASLSGIEAAAVQLRHAAGKDVLLVERFDRQRLGQAWGRKAVVSALTLFELDEMMARYASYEHLAEILRHRSERPVPTLRELFQRLVFNILCGNTDDHARNHATFWDGRRLALTPAYDVCPQARLGREASQAMLVHGEGRSSKLSLCIRAATSFMLSAREAEVIIEHQVRTIVEHWRQLCEEAQVSDVDRALLWGRVFLNPFAFEDAPARVRQLARSSGFPP